MAYGLNKLEGEVALVTGAGRGIGASVVRALAGAGACVVATSRRTGDAERTVAGLGAQAVALCCDVADHVAIAAAVRKAEARVGRITILVNNAGVIHPIGHLHETDPAAWATAMTTLLVGAAAAARAVLPGMLAAGRGTIVNLSSGAAHRPLEGWSAYCAGKAGLAMLTRSIALEYAMRGIRAFGFAPGLVDTGMQAEIRASGINPVSALDRSALADPTEPARAIAYLCSPAADDLAGGEVDIRDPAFRAAGRLVVTRYVFLEITAERRAAQAGRFPSADHRLMLQPYYCLEIRLCWPVRLRTKRRSVPTEN